MGSEYFHEIAGQMGTRVWVNNPTGLDLAKAIAAGAISGTTNPSFCSKLIQNEPDYIYGIIDEVVVEVADDEVAADLVFQRATARFMEGFLPLFEKSGGGEGFVTMQDDPEKDGDADQIVQAALRHSQVGKNFMAKIPIIESGMAAMVALIEKNIAICATECFSIAQAIAICELYESTCEKTGNRPPFFVTHITGIYDEDLQETVAKNKISIDPEILKQAGSIIARKEYRLIHERGYHATMLGGGARGLHHFTEFVGGDVHVTMNWSTFDELIQADMLIVSRIDTVDSPEVIAELCEKLPDFQRAYVDDGYTTAEFEMIPGVIRFRNSFIKGWRHLASEVQKRRALIIA
jgi:transaldolase